MPMQVREPPPKGRTRPSAASPLARARSDRGRTVRIGEDLGDPVARPRAVVHVHAAGHVDAVRTRTARPSGAGRSRRAGTGAASRRPPSRGGQPAVRSRRGGGPSSTASSSSHVASRAGCGRARRSRNVIVAVVVSWPAKSSVSTWSRTSPSDSAPSSSRGVEQHGDDVAALVGAPRGAISWSRGQPPRARSIRATGARPAQRLHEQSRPVVAEARLPLLGRVGDLVGDRGRCRAARAWRSAAPGRGSSRRGRPRVRSPRLERSRGLLDHRVDGRGHCSWWKAGSMTPARRWAPSIVRRPSPINGIRSPIDPVAPDEILGVRDQHVVVGLGS